MSSESLEKLKRLITFRERQRDLAAKDMEDARKREDDAESERLKAAQSLTEELDVIRQATGKVFQPADLELAVQSAKWAQTELKLRENELAEKKKETEAQRSKLLASHQKVKQMETLHRKRKEAREKHQMQTQQGEQDDLVAIREVQR